MGEGRGKEVCYLDTCSSRALKDYVSVRMMGVSKTIMLSIMLCSKNKKLGNYCQTKVVLSPNRSKINTIQRVFF